MQLPSLQMAIDAYVPCSVLFMLVCLVLRCSIAEVLYNIDTAVQYGEDAEVKVSGVFTCEKFLLHAFFFSAHLLTFSFTGAC